jgi:diguanylate cyclase (GGDEF)-like protein
VDATTETRLLILIIALLSLIGCLSWCVMSWLVRISPLASRRFALANLLIFAGSSLIYIRPEPPPFGLWFGSNAALLTGFYFVYAGLLKLFKLKWQSRSALLCVIIALITLWLLSQNNNNAWLISAVFAAAAASLFGHAAFANYQGINQEFSRAAALSVSSPFVLVALFFFIRFSFIVHDHQAVNNYIALKHPDSLAQWWFIVVLTVVINLSLVGNAFARLVTKIRALADRDSLTGLWTRRVMQQQLLNHARSSERHRSVFSILLIDLDYFKKINDSYGHQIGDVALLHASECFKQALRADDWLARYGGEEFMILLPHTTTADAAAIAKRICLQLAAEPFAAVTGLQLTASIGVASYHPDDSIEQLISSVDQALYQAKAQGRNQVCIADSPGREAKIS